MSQANMWLEGWLSGDLPQAELAPFEDWLRSDAEHRRIFLTAVALDQDLRAAYRQPATLLLRRWRPAVMLVGAAAVILIAVGLAMWNSAVVAPPEPRVVAGWTLSEGLVLGDAVPGGPARITSSQAGELKRPGSLVQLQPGTEVRLEEGGSELRVATGRLTVTLEEALNPGPDPSRMIRVATSCGTLIVEPGSKLELTSDSADAPFGGPVETVEVLVLAGSIIPPAVRAMPVAPQPVEAGAGIRLTRTGKGPVTLTRLPAP